MQTLYEYPLLKLHEIKHPWYKGFVVVSEEDFLQSDHAPMSIRMSIADYGCKGYWVQRVYPKYQLIDSNAIVYSLQMVKLRDTQVIL